jgi:hypothetical protein
MRIAALVTAIALGAALPPPAAAESKKLTSCEMAFSLKGWSALYKTTKGEGTVTCDNGQRLEVTISSKGGGLTAGKTEIREGQGVFSEVASIDEVLGTYAGAEAHGGAVKSGTAQALTKGEVSLALSGKGSGWDLGVAFSGFTIKKK